MIYQLILLVLLVNIGWTLRCKVASPSNCLFNSTCTYDIKECESSEFSSNIRGGVYCTTIVNNINKVIVGKMDCMYDQETSKTCKNQSQCIMKYTNKEKQFLHCCCDKDFCNQNFTIPNLSTDMNNPTKDGEDSCENFQCKHGNLILFSLIICFIIIIIIIICCVYRDKFKKSRKKIFRMFIKTPLGDEPNDPLFEPLNGLNDERTDEINFNDLKFGNSIKQGRYSFIHQGIFNNDQVAIKSLSNTNDSNQGKDLFEHEKQIYSLPSMKHENILKYYGYSITPSGYCLITELSQYGSLRDVLRSRLLKDENELILICQQISNGLEFLHTDFRKNSSKENSRPSIAHRDFKSDNILYINDHKLVISDFAMALKLEQNQNYPNEQQQIGTARYMSPEILAGTIGCETNALLKCDVYALGIVLWEILSRYPFENQDLNNNNYEMPFEKQLKDRNFNINNPEVNEMLQIINLKSPLNRPLIKSSWRKTNNININEILSTVEQCWDQNPEGRISAALVAHRMRQLFK